MMAVYKPGNRGTIRSTAGYSIQDACVKLYEAMKGFGTNEKEVINVVCAHTVQERQQIKKKYQTKYGKDLEKELEGELSFSFAKLVAALMTDPDDFILECINKSICTGSKKKAPGGKLFKRLSSLFTEGLRGSDFIVIGLLCTKSNKDLKVIKKAYTKKYGDKLEEKIVSDGNNMPHDVVSFILDMISGEREEEGEVDSELLSEDCHDLRVCKDEEILHQLLHDRSFTHLRCLFDEVMNVSGKTVGSIVEDFEGSISVELKEAYMAVVTLLTEGEAAFYADRVKGAIDGAGTDDDTLIKAVVLRAEVDLADMLEIYEKKYKIDMMEDVAGDVSGDYKEVFKRILIKPPPGLETNKDEKVRMGSSQEINKDGSAEEIIQEKKMTREEYIAGMAEKAKSVENKPETAEKEIIQEKKMSREEYIAGMAKKAKSIEVEKVEKVEVEVENVEEEIVPEEVVEIEAEPPNVEPEVEEAAAEEVEEQEIPEKEEDKEEPEEEEKPEEEPEQTEEEEAVVVVVEEEAAVVVEEEAVAVETEEPNKQEEDSIAESVDITSEQQKEDTEEGQGNEEPAEKGHEEQTKPSSPASREL